MSSDSDGSYYSEMEVCDDGQWKKVRHKRKARSRLGSISKKNKHLSPEEINIIIKGDQQPGSSETSSIQTTSKKDTDNKKTNYNKNKNNDKEIPQQKQTSNINTYTLPNTGLNEEISTQNERYIRQKNISGKMKEISQKPFKTLFYIKTPETLTRKMMSDIWDKEHQHTDDMILKTKMGFLLKTNQEKNIITSTLKKLIGQKHILNYKETQPSTVPTNTNASSIGSYSVVIGSVEPDITEEEISEFLVKSHINHRYCKRIVAKATNKPTYLIRIITGCMSSSEKLLNEGLFYKHRHYPVYPSLPPAPIPQPCSRCLQFTHTRDNCTSPIKCTKCSGPHHYTKCNTQLPPKCTGCGAEDHTAWSLKCPKRPLKPIDGIPNNQIKTLNRKSNEIDPKITKNSKIHSPVTVHDMIINTYLNKLNKDKYTDREELISKLRKRFVAQYNIDTVTHFSGSRMYVLMFDLEQPSTISPTQPIQGVNNVQVHVDN